jgi:hypothetical protein
VRCVASLTAPRGGPSIAAYAARLTVVRGSDAHMSPWSRGRFALALTGFRRSRTNVRRHSHATPTQQAFDLLNAYPGACCQRDYAGVRRDLEHSQRGRPGVAVLGPPVVLGARSGR